jgi:hypothetical protein
MVKHSGRRPGHHDTRGQVLQEARRLFAAGGYHGTSVRQIAGAADVDPALVHYYFGSKKNLFLAVPGAPIRPEDLLPEILAEGPQAVPERLIRTFLSVWEDPVTGPVVIGFLRTAVASGVSPGLVNDCYGRRIAHAVVHELGDHVADEDASFQASLVASQLVGLALTRYVLAVEPLASKTSEDVATAFAPTVRRSLFGGLPTATVQPVAGYAVRR